MSLVLTAVIASTATSADREASPRGRVLRPICVGDGWCWEHPALTRADLVAISGSSATDVWIVAHSGGSTLLRWNGTGWTGTGTTPRSIMAVWAAAPADAWAVGLDGAIVRWDGRTWTEVESPTRAPLRRVWGRAADDVWALGDQGTALHYDGRTWKAIATGTAKTINAAWAAEPGEAWLVGFGGVLLRWDGERARDTPGAPAEVIAIGGSAKGDAWALTPGGEWWHWDGQRWSRAEGAPDASRVRTAAARDGYGWAGAPDAIWRFGYSKPGRFTVERLDRSRWTETPFPAITLAERTLDVRAIWGSRSDDVWASGSKGALWHWDGKAWSLVVGAERRLWSVFAIGPDEIWAAGGGVSRRDANGVWRDLPASPPEQLLQALFGSASNDVWACGDSIWHWDGKTWTQSLPKFACTGLWGVGQEIWASGWNGVAHRAEGAWDIPADREELRAVWSPGRGEAWAAGTSFDKRGRVLRFGDADTEWPNPQGDDRSLPPQFGSTLLAIWGSSARDVYAGGYADGLMHWDGKAWRTVASFPKRNPISIWGRGRNDVWVANQGGGVQHWDGRAWREVASGVIGIRQITGTAARVWVATEDGGILSRPRIIEPR